jgi:hypothetical protein
MEKRIERAGKLQSGNPPKAVSIRDETRRQPEVRNPPKAVSSPSKPDVKIVMMVTMMMMMCVR